MKKIFSIVALATLMVAGMTSCTNSDDELAQANTRGIGFDIHADGSLATRGYALNSSNVATALPNFQVWAYDDETDDIYMGASSSTGKTVTNTSMDGSSWDYSPVQYWPVNALNFVALAPAAPNGVSSNATVSAENVVTLTSNVTLSTNVEEQDDIMYAEADGATKATDGGNVPFTFKHALSQIVFRGKFNSEGAITKVTIAEIALGGINKAGTLVFNSEGNFYGGTALAPVTKPAVSGTPAVFSLDNGDLEGYVYDVADVITPAVLYTDADEAAAAGKEVGDVKTPAVTRGVTPFDLTVSNNGTKKNAWMMIPQATTAWDGTSYTAGIPTSGAYIKLRVKLEKDGVVILGNAEADAVYLPLTVNWDRSTKYIYTIEFNGDNALTPITFSVAAENWTDADPQPGTIEY